MPCGRANAAIPPALSPHADKTMVRQSKTYPVVRGRCLRQPTATPVVSLRVSVCAEVLRREARGTAFALCSPGTGADRRTCIRDECHNVPFRPPPRMGGRFAPRRLRGHGDLTQYRRVRGRRRYQRAHQDAAVLRPAGQRVPGASRNVSSTGSTQRVRRHRRAKGPRGGDRARRARHKRGPQRPHREIENRTEGA